MFHIRTGTLLLFVAAGCGKETTPETTTEAHNADGPAQANVAHVGEDHGAGQDHKGELHWGYEGAGGPEHWGSLKEEYAKCGAGQAQTPIDLPAEALASGKPPGPIMFDYQPIPLAIVNNGHTVQVDNTVPSSIRVDGQLYYFKQAHLHAPSEHTVDGKHHDMELHLVHRNAADELAVVGIFLDKGKENEVLKPMWDYLPIDVSEESALIADESIDFRPLITPDSGYYHYLGSLTTPPCSEGVKWFVLVPTVEVSENQIKRFKSLMHGENARPVQPLQGRQVAIYQPQ